MNRTDTSETFENPTAATIASMSEDEWLVYLGILISDHYPHFNDVDAAMIAGMEQVETNRDFALKARAQGFEPGEFARYAAEKCGWL